MFDMFSNIIKNLFAGPATRLYPFVKRKTFADVRGQITGIDPEVCIYCGICQRKCPALCITVDKATKTWTLDPYKCIVCGVCEEACPKHCINMTGEYRQPVHRKEMVTQSKAPTPQE
ncbi:MAG TPA: 4Fe-4S dicluster domain-containing protein [Armatimonadota bacterium]